MTAHTSLPRPGFEACWRAASEIDGWLTSDQARMLYEAAARVPAGGRAVEIGSHHGKSTVVLAAGLTEASRLTAVDPFDDPRWGGGPDAYRTFHANIRTTGVEERVEPCRGLSAEALERTGHEPIDLVYIDGAHDFDSVRLDIDGWGARLRDGGQLLIHDSFSSVGVTRAVLARLAVSDRYALVARAGSLARFTKQSALPARVRLASATRVAWGLAYFSRNVAVKLLLRLNLGRGARLLLGHTQRGDPY